jgi:hypothetical protein
MKVFEYKLVYAGSHELPITSIEKFFNDYGKDGWELVYVFEGKFVTSPTIICNYKFVFMREIKRGRK